MKSIKAILKPLLKPFLERLRGRYADGSIEQYAFKHGETNDVRKDIKDKYGYCGDLLDLFSDNKDFIVHKWHHYIPLYERYFSSYRGQRTRFLEIGVSKGGSLQLWRKYFGSDAVIFGIDIDPECEKYNGLAGQVRIGSQVDERFLESVIKEMGGIDIVLDDGSHRMDHIPATLKALFPYLSDGGIYVIEDLHTAYWKSYGGGYGRKTNFFHFIMEIVDDIHHWYHSMALKQPIISKDCVGVHIHDSIVVLEKNKIYEPVHSQIG